MKNKEILFVIIRDCNTGYQECLESLQALNVPVGYTVNIVTFANQEGNANIAAGCNEVIRQTVAKYKVYLRQNVFFVNENFLEDIISIFEQDDQIAMIGMLGADSIPSNGVWQDSSQKYGKIYKKIKSNAEEINYKEVQENYKEVRILDGNILVTQYDLKWNDDVFDGLYFYDAAQCQEFLLAGYKLVVPKQTLPWCLLDAEEIVNEEFDSFRKKYLETYHSYQATVCSTENLLYKFGRNTKLGPNTDIQGAEGICLGNDVVFGKDNLLELPARNYVGNPQIVIRNGSEIGNRCTFSALNGIYIGENVKIGNNVRIADYHYDYKRIGIPIMYQKMISTGAISIDKGTVIDDNVVVEENVKIGKGCIIKANSFVSLNIPDYCSVSGNPAKIVEVFDRCKEQWITISDVNQLNEIIDTRRSMKPLITIAIPTYNRAGYLNRCLKAIFEQIGNDELFEVLISDNNSTDDTGKIVERYKDCYKNLTYHKNETNIGGDQNIYLVSEMANGEYVALLGDDDFYQNETLYHLVDAIYQHRNCAMIYLAWLGNSDSYTMYSGHGINEYLEKISFGSTWISSLVFKKETLNEISQRDKFTHISFNQVYLQLELLRRNPNYLVLSGPIFREDTGEEYKKSSTYNLSEIFMKQYLDLLYYFKSENGLNEVTIKNEKRKLLEKLLLPRARAVVTRDLNYSLDGMMELYIFYYQNEEYFVEKKCELEIILNQYQLIKE